MLTGIVIGTDADADVVIVIAFVVPQKNIIVLYNCFFVFLFP